MQYPTQFNDDARKVTGNFVIANGFNRFFSNIGPALARNIPKGNTNFSNYLNQKVEESIFLNPVTDEEIIEIVKDAKTKYSKDHDSIDMSLVKLAIPYIVKPLKHIFNNSLQKGVFLDSMKIARVIPIFKTGDVQEFSKLQAYIYTTAVIFLGPPLHSNTGTTLRMATFTHYAVGV